MKFSFDIPSYEYSNHMLLEKAVISLVENSDSLIGPLPSRVSEHGGPVRNVREPRVLDQEFESSRHSSKLELDDVRALNIEAWISMITDLARQRRDELAQSVIRSANQITEATGNVVDAKGKPLSIDFLIQVFDKMPIPFDEHDEPLLGKLVMNPHTFEQIAPRMALINEDEVQMKLWREFIEKKRQEYHAQKRTRRLSL